MREGSLDTILVYPDLAYSGLHRPAPPFSVLFIADALHRSGVDVGVFDLRYDGVEEVARAAASYTPRYLGISVMTGPQIGSALEVARAVRRASPDTLLVWGGVHPTLLPAQTLRHPLVDLVVRGDGERAYTLLVGGEKWSRIAGLAFRRGGHIYDLGLAPPTDMEQVGIPWDLVDPRRYVERGRSSLVTSRGCPYRCAFCYNASVRQPWRGWSAERCAEELEAMAQMGAEDILFFDDAFFANQGRVRRLLPHLRRLGLTWTAEMRVDQLSGELARRLRRAGCLRLFFGAESGSPRLLRLLNKGIRVSQIRRSARVTREAGIEADYSWMVGIPTETEWDKRATITAIKAVQRENPEAEFTVKIYTPYPGTPLYRMAIKEGFRPPASLPGWAGLSRVRAQPYHPRARRLETLAITSALVAAKYSATPQAPSPSS